MKRTLYDSTTATDLPKAATMVAGYVDGLYKTVDALRARFPKAQIVTITVKSGYNPKMSTVQAGIPTVIRFDTNGTFDCSAGIRIPSLGISQSLPSNGTTDVSIGTLSAGGSIKGTCSMGMYTFEVDAQS